ncbi:hypothetical protein, partial [Burkholderia pseudomallei]|uniref:hypothetical protein n=3 Tax=Burkholderia pseudomallei TaxID=28450 RepID=UPI001C3C32DC
MARLATARRRAAAPPPRARCWGAGGVLNGRVQPGGDAEARQEARGSGRGPRVITRQLTVDRPLAIRR